MAKWDITKAKCPNCEETFQMYVDANEARIDAEAKLAMAVDALRGWIDFANAEGMPVLLSDLEAAELKGGKDEWKCPINYTGCTKNCGSYGCGN